MSCETISFQFGDNRLQLHLRTHLKPKASGKSLGIRAIAVCQGQSIFAIVLHQPVHVNVQWIADGCGSQSLKIELLGDVVEQMILNHQHQMLAEMFECFDLVVQLHQDRLGRHLPVHAERLLRSCLPRGHFDALFL